MGNKFKNKNFSFKALITNESIGALLIWLVVVLVLIITTGDTFLTTRNFINLSRYASFYVMVGLGVLIIFTGGGMDLSLGATMGMAGMVTAYLTKQGLPLVIVIVAGLLVGLVIGAFNGYIIGYWKFPAMVATLGTQQIVRGLLNAITKGYPIDQLPDNFTIMGTGSFLGISLPVWIVAFMCLLTWYVLNKTVFGRRAVATGGNEQAAIVSGINTKKVRMQAYMYGGMMAAIAGTVLTARMTTAQTATGTGFELEAIAGAIIGGASVGGGKGTVFGTLFGILVIYTVKNGMSLLSVNAYWQTVVQGTIILLAIFLDIVRRNSHKKE